MGVCFNKPRLEDHQEITSRRKNQKLSVIPVKSEDQKEAKAFVFQETYNTPKKHSVETLKCLVTLEGKPNPKHQRGFEDKLTRVEGQNLDFESLETLGVGIACKKGLKPDPQNQDDFSVVLDNCFQFLGVYDGHGSFGHEVSNYIHSLIPRYFISNEKSKTEPLELFNEVFPRVDNELKELCNQEDSEFDCVFSGSTATTAFIYQKKLYIGHVGDSRAVLGVKEGSELKALRVSEDHKPTLQGEKTRIEKAGGEVKRLPEDIPYRVFMKGKDYPGLSTSRAFGDLSAHSVGVTSEPQTLEINLDESHKYLVLCSDGVTEFIEDEEMITIVRKYGKRVKSAADKLASVAWRRWIQNEDDVVDDITAIVVYLPQLLVNIQT